MATLGGGPSIPAYLSNIPVGFSLGCWLEGSRSGKALDGAFFQDGDAMTPSECSSLCSNYTLFGLEYGSECECGNNIVPGRAFPVNDSSCSVPCTGNSSLYCGGSNTLYIYQQLPPPPPPPPGLFSNLSFTAAGCLAEPTDGSRALDGFLMSDANMTPEFCADICGMSNYQYFGVQYGNECWCDNTVSAGAVWTDASNCNVPCGGDSTQTCGGIQVLDLFNGTYINTTAYGTPKNVVPPGLTRRMFGEDRPLKGRFYNPEPRLLASIRPVPEPVGEGFHEDP